MLEFDYSKIDFNKLNGIVPAIVQDSVTKNVLMLGFMNKNAIAETLKQHKVIFWSRTKQRLWLKGETSGNYLSVISISTDCDNDTILVQAIPNGPTCHTGKVSCFDPIEI